MMVPFESSPDLALCHGFFGRQGGVSAGGFASLNMSLDQGDCAAHVATNRNRALAALGLSGKSLHLLKQIHSNRVHIATRENNTIPEADALVSTDPDLVLGILTADCTPILFADSTAGIIGAAHAGWRGAVYGIVDNTIATMVKLGAQPTRIAAVIGPTITPPNYEVGGQFCQNVLTRHPDSKKFFITLAGGTVHFDLPGFIHDQLQRAGIRTIAHVGGCTYTQPDRYFSHRYATHHGIHTGRQIAVITLSV